MSTLPGGFTTRRLSLSPGQFPDGTDVDLAQSVVRAAETVVLGASHMPRETVRSLLSSPETLREESLLVFDSTGEVCGLSFLEWEPEARSTFINVYAVPTAAAALLPHLVDSAVATTARLAERPWQMEASAFEDDHLLKEVLAVAGFTGVRRFWRMRIDFEIDAPAGTPAAPRGARIRVVDGDADRRLLHELFERSFRDHFGFVPRPFEDWIGWFDARGDSRPDLQWIAELDGGPVGLCLVDDSRIEEGLAYVRTLGVVPEARGLGIARWLLAEAFAHARAEGRHGAALAVDSDNVTGATRLYESLGMHAYQVIDLFRRPL